jgi:hypothetical protein
VAATATAATAARRRLRRRWRRRPPLWRVLALRDFLFLDLYQFFASSARLFVFCVSTRARL